VDIAGAVEAGNAFLAEHGYEKMKAVSYDEYNNVASVIFARIVNGITVYPEKLTVKIALDNAEVTGLSAGDLLHQPAAVKIKEPAMTEEEVRKLLNPNFKVKDMSL